MYRKKSEEEIAWGHKVVEALGSGISTSALVKSGAYDDYVKKFGKREAWSVTEWLKNMYNKKCGTKTVAGNDIKRKYAGKGVRKFSSVVSKSEYILVIPGGQVMGFASDAEAKEAISSNIVLSGSDLFKRVKYTVNISVSLK